MVDADVRKDNLRDKFDVFVIPANPPAAITTGRAQRGEGGGGEGAPPLPPEYRGGLGPDGTAALDAFVHAIRPLERWSMLGPVP